MRFRLSTPWPLQGGLAPSGTVIDTDNGVDHWSAWAQRRIPPVDAQALDQATYDFMRRVYAGCGYSHLLGPPPPGATSK